MSRIRSIHQGLFTDEALCEASEPAVLLLVGLLTEADDHGIFEWKPKQLRIRLRPARDGDVAPLLEELVRVDAIRMFENEGRSFGAIRNFCKWQRPQKPIYQFDLPEELYDYVKATAGKPQTAAEGYMMADLHKKQAGKCAYCPAEISRYQKKANSARIIERNPGQGLTAENAVAVCRNCCDKKGSLPESEFFALRSLPVARENENSHSDNSTVARETDAENVAGEAVAHPNGSENSANLVVGSPSRVEEKESRVEKGGGEEPSRENRANGPPPEEGRMTEDWVPDKDLILRWITEHGLERAHYQRELIKFRNYWISQSGKNATRADWNPIFENWLLKGKKDGDFK